MNARVILIKICLSKILILLLFISCAGGDKSSHQEAKAPQGDEEAASGEYIVTLAKAGNEEILFEIFSPHEIKAVEKITDTIFLIQFETKSALSEMQSYLDNEKIEAIQPNFTYKVESEGRLPVEQ